MAERTTNNNKLFLHVTGLNVGYPVNRGLVTEIIRDVNWTIGHDEFWALVGESGSGKTTLLLAMAGLVGFIGGRVTKGTIQWSVLQKEPKVGKDHVYLPQGARSAIYPLEKIGKQIRDLFISAEGLKKNYATQETKRLLSELWLRPEDQVAKLLPGQMSGGMRQRAALALALVGNPMIIFLDEPMVGLDLTTENQICNMLSDIRANKGVSVVAIMHDLVRASQIASHVAFLHKGRIVELGPAKDILSSPKHPYSREIIAKAQHTFHKVTPPQKPISDWPDSMSEVTVPEAAGRPFVRVRDLYFAYPVHGWRSRSAARKRVLEDISLELAPGTITGLVGESGSGKTTLAKCLNGLLRPLAVRLEVAEYNLLLRLKKRERRSFRSTVQLVFQESEDSFDPHWSLMRSLKEPLKLHGLTKNRLWRNELERLMNIFGLSGHLLSRKPTQVSGGELQRLAIIRALLLSPQFLIADEPFSALDVQSGSRVLTELRRICIEKETTLLLITHDISLAKTYCDQLQVLLSGVMVEKGPAEVVGGTDGHPYTRALMDSVPVWMKSLPELRSRMTEIKKGACPFAVNCGHVEEKCLKGPIPLVEVSPGHEVRCLLPTLS